MKKFNKNIKIEVSVDMIAEQFLATINAEEKHRELIAEAVIGNLESKNRLGGLYNALNGFNPTINFAVGDVVIPEDISAYGYWTPKSIEEKNSCYQKIAEAKVISIDEYADKTLLIEFPVPKKNGSMTMQQERVNHTNCSKIPKAI